MTTLIATSVVRGTQQGESHGGICLIDLETEQVTQKVDWNTFDIDWQGRGWDRGLRGIAFEDERVLVAASDELFVFSPEFKRLASFRNPYLRHCHEIARYGRQLYLTSTGFDSILIFDLDRNRFLLGLHLARGKEGFTAKTFDPNGSGGPPPNNRLHLNNVYCDDSGMYLSGLKTGALLAFDGKRVVLRAELPMGVHNARPWRDGVLFNDTAADRVRYATAAEELVFKVPRYDPAVLTHTNLDDSRVARQAFARGLCVIDDDTIAAGSSPSTVALHSISQQQTLRWVALSFDIRNAIHGLQVWPY